MLDPMQGECSTSSGTTSIESAARKAYQLCQLGAAGTEFVKIDSQLYRVRVSKVEEGFCEELKVAGRVK